MKIPDVKKLGAVDIEGGGRFLVLMVREGVAERLVAASPGARHDVPGLEVERLARAIATVENEHRPEVITDGRYERARLIAAEYARLSSEPADTPPVLFPGYPLLHPGDPVYPTKEDIEG